MLVATLPGRAWPVSPFYYIVLFIGLLSRFEILLEEQLRTVILELYAVAHVGQP